MNKNDYHNELLNATKKLFGEDVFNKIMNIPFEFIFGGNIKTVKEPEYTQLDDGYELRPIKLSKKQAQNDYIVRNKFSHLYHNGKKVSDNIFRQGGYNNGFGNNDYCILIYYTTDKKSETGFDIGTTSIIDKNGNVILSSNGLNYVSYIGGHLASLKNKIYNLKTKEPIMVNSDKTINCENSIIVEHRYNWANKELNIPLGVYKIDKQTCEITLIDNICK